MVTLNFPKKIIRGQDGFTFLELLIAITLTAILVPACIVFFVQINTDNAANTNQMVAIKQVENALFEINNDTQMSWPSQIAISHNSSFSSDPLVLKWTGSDGTAYIVTYKIVTTNGIYDFQRSEQINGGPQVTTNIAAYINSSSSYYSFDGTTLFVSLTATVKGSKPVSETRILEVKPRSTN